MSDTVMAAGRPPNINELLPGCQSWFTHCGIAGGSGNGTNSEMSHLQ